MARRVIHYSDCGNFYDYYREHNEVPKTLCNREMTTLYHFSDDTNRVTCSRCIKRLEKLQMMDGQVNGRAIRIANVKDIGNCGDEKVDLYLQRLGIG